MAVPTARKPRHNPHTIVDGPEGATFSTPSSRGAPKWADDPDEVNAELEAMDARDEAKRTGQHVAAHKENIRRDRSAAARSTRERSSAHTAALGEAARRDKAAADAAAARRPSAILGRASSRARTVASAGPSSGGGLSVTDGSGFVMALLVVGWVVLPLLNGGPAAMRNLWRAKFFNKDAKGDPLP